MVAFLQIVPILRRSMPKIKDGYVKTQLTKINELAFNE